MADGPSLPAVQVLRRNRDFRLLYLAQLVSYLGDWFATVALIGLILDRTDSELLAASVFVVQVLPGLLATPLAVRRPTVPTAAASSS